MINVFKLSWDWLVKKLRQVLGLPETTPKAASVLSQALINRNQNAVRRCVRRGLNVHLLASIYGTVLHTVYRLTDGDMVFIALFIEWGLDPEDRDHAGNTLLDTAVIEGRLDLCRFLLERGVALRVTESASSAYSTPVQKILRYKQDTLLTYFIDYLEKTSPVLLPQVLYQAVIGDHPDAVAQFVGRSVDWNACFEAGANLVHFAASPRVYDLLIGAGVDGHQKDDLGLDVLSKWLTDRNDLMVLHWFKQEQVAPIVANDYIQWILAATKRSNLDILRRLFHLSVLEDQGVIAATRTELLLWILCFAIEERVDLDTLKFLIDEGAAINGCDLENKTPLMVAAQRNNLYYLKVLLKAGADPDLTDISARTAVMYAVIHCSVKCIDPLAQITRNLNHRDHKGFDAALHCAISGSAEIAQHLARHGVSVNQVYPEGKTALIFAALGGNVSMIDYLATQGVDLESADEKKRTALMYAAGNGHVDATRRLLELGANSRCVDREGHTAMALAQSSEIANLFHANLDVTTKELPRPPLPPTSPLQGANVF